MGRHELPMDRASSNDDGPYGILWSSPTCTISCSTTSTPACTDDATALLDGSPISSPSIDVLIGGSFDGTYVWLSTCYSDDATGSMSSTRLVPVTSARYDAHSLPSQPTMAWPYHHPQPAPSPTYPPQSMKKSPLRQHNLMLHQIHTPSPPRPSPHSPP